MFYIGGRDCVLCQFIEPVTFARCTFIFALRNIALGGYLDFFFFFFFFFIQRIKYTENNIYRE